MRLRNREAALRTHATVWRTYQRIHSAARRDRKYSSMRSVRWAHITGISDVWVKVRILLMKNRHCCLTGGASRSRYGSVVEKKNNLPLKFHTQGSYLAFLFSGQPPFKSPCCDTISHLKEGRKGCLRCERVRADVSVAKWKNQLRG